MKLWPAAVLALVALLGCKEPRVVEPPPPMSVGVVHEDLPAPEGFSYVDNFGNTSPTGAFRVLTQTMRGNRRVEQAVNFYKEVFPRHKWTMEKEEGNLKTDARLSFVKGDERCGIEIKDESQTSVFIRLKVDRKN
jgi:hypothetical protein